MGVAWPLAEGCGLDAQWYVVRTKTRKEDFAVQQLAGRGIHVFLPRVLEYGQSEVAPLFAGYLFVRIALVDHYYRVAWTPGVRGFIAFGATPTPISDAVIRLIASTADEAGIIRQEPRLRAGDRVQITGGPLAGLMAVIEQPCSQRGRVKIFLDFLRRGATVELPIGLVDPI
jgi:transcription antitermination factor NusG